jgi:DNA-binding LytR/AlgR family response regulator
MNKVTCIVVDDEPLAREGLVAYIQQIDFLELKATCKNALEANTILHQQKIDVLFLDIEMPYLNGINFLKSLNQSPWIIFTTAYSEYALEGYQFQVIDYLIKPISLERFLMACNKVLKIFNLQKTDNQTLISKNEEDFIFIKVDKQLVKILVKEIIFIEGMQNYIIIQTEKARLMTLIPLKNVFELLSKNDFIQVHKSYIIAKAKMDAIEGNEIILGKYRVPISRRLKDQVLQRIANHKLN